MRAALSLVLLLVAGCASSPSTAPVPVTFIDAPSAILPDNIKGLWGKWSGTWDSNVHNILVVEYIDQTTARVVYSWGNRYPERGPTRGWTRVWGTVEPGVLRLTLPNSAKVTYRLQSDGTLQGTYEWYGNVSRIGIVKATLHRSQP